MIIRVGRLPQGLVVSTTRRQLSYCRNPNKSVARDSSSARYDALIYHAGSSRDFPTLRQLLDKRVRDGVVFNRNNTFLFITRTTRDFSAVVDELYHCLSRLRIGVSKKTSFDSFIDRLCKIGRTDESLHVLQRVLTYCDCADTLTFHPILQVLTRKKDMMKAWSMVELMKDNGLAPDVTVYNYLLAAYCRSGEVAEASEVVARMEEEEVRVDERTYDALVLGACRAAGAEGGIRLLRRMVGEEFRPMCSTCVHVIDALLRTGRSSMALELVMEFGGGRGEGFMDPQTFGILATRLLASGKMEEAEFLLGEMKERRLWPRQDRRRQRGQSWHINTC